MELRSYRPLELEQDAGSRKRRFLEGLPVLGDPENQAAGELGEARAFGRRVEPISQATVALLVETRQEAARIVPDPVERDRELSPLTAQTEILTGEVEKLGEALDQTAQFDTSNHEAAPSRTVLGRDRALQQQEARLTTLSHEDVSADTELRRLYLKRVVDVATRQTETTRHSTESIWAAAPEQASKLHAQQLERTASAPLQAEAKDGPTEQELSDRVERNPGRLDQTTAQAAASQALTAQHEYASADTASYTTHPQVTTPPPLPPSRVPQGQQLSRGWLLASVVLIAAIGLMLLLTL